VTARISLPPDKGYFYDGFASEFDAKMNMYDTLKRVRIVFDELLPESIEGKLLLDAGCGTGWFSRRAHERGAHVVSLDVGVHLLNEVRKKTDSLCVAGTAMQLCFPDATFDIVVSSEMIEHTPDPRAAFSELARVLKPGGVLVLTTPNRVWYPSVVIANILKIRPYEGYENWVHWSDLRRWSTGASLTLLTMRGFHLFPFQFAFLHSLIDTCDRFGDGWLGRLMINIALKGRKL